MCSGWCPALASLPKIGNGVRGITQNSDCFSKYFTRFNKIKIYTLPLKSASLKPLDHHSYNSNNDFTAFRCAASRNVKTTATAG